MNLQFVVTDMDGTFLDSLSAFDREAFCRLKVRCEEKGSVLSFVQESNVIELLES